MPYKLLIVDDEVDIREFAKSFFRRRGVEVFTADNGLSALQIIRSEKPDLVLLDITMEELSGIDVLKKLRAEGNDIKVIMVTGVEDEAVVNEANSWAIRGYIHKPLVLEELETIVMTELKGQSISS